MRNRGVIIAIIMLGLLLASCGGAEPTINAGRLYENNCLACHGADRQGMPNLGPALTPESMAGKSDTEMKDTISNGKTNTAMPPWKDTLSSMEIDALILFIKTSP